MAYAGRMDGLNDNSILDIRKLISGKDGQLFVTTKAGTNIFLAKVLGLITTPVTQVAAFAGVSFGVADTINTFKDFESAMSSAAATAGLDLSNKADIKIYQDMEKAARAAGAATTKTAAESANALEYMSLSLAGMRLHRFKRFRQC